MTKNKAEIPDGDKDTPNEQIELAKLLQEYKVKADLCNTIAAHIIATGGENVLSSREALTKALIEWSNDIAPVRRKQIVDRWCVSKMIGPQTSSRVGGQMRGAGDDDDLGGDLLYRVENDAAGEPRVAAVKSDKEPGTTYAKARAVCERMKQDRNEVWRQLVYSEERRRWEPDMKSSSVQQNLTAARAYARQVNEDLGYEVPPDPEEQVLAKMDKEDEIRERWRARMGGASNPVDDGIKILEAAQKMNTAGAKPSADPAVQQSMATLSADFQKFRDDTKERMHAQELAEQARNHQQVLVQKDSQISALSMEVRSLRGDLTSLVQQVNEVKGRPGKTAYDLLDSMVSKMPDRRDLKEIAFEVMGKPPVLSSRSAEQTAVELGGLVEEMEGAANLEEAADWIFSKG